VVSYKPNDSTNQWFAEGTVISFTVDIMLSEWLIKANISGFWAA